MDMSSIVWLEPDSVWTLHENLSRGLYDEQDNTSQRGSLFPFICYSPQSEMTSQLDQKLVSIIMTDMNHRSKIQFFAAAPIKVDGMMRALFCVFKMTPVASFDQSQIDLLQEMTEIASQLAPRKTPLFENVPSLRILTTILGHLQVPIEEAQLITRKVWADVVYAWSDSAECPNTAFYRKTSTSSKSSSGKYSNITQSDLESSSAFAAQVFPNEDFSVKLQHLESSIQRMQQVFSVMQTIMEKLLALCLLSSGMTTVHAQSDLLKVSDVDEQLHSTIHGLCQLFSVELSPSSSFMVEPALKNSSCSFCSSTLWMAIYAVLLKHHGTFDRVEFTAHMNGPVVDSRSRSDSLASTSCETMLDCTSHRLGSLDDATIVPTAINASPVSPNVSLDTFTEQGVLQVQLNLISTSSISADVCAQRQESGEFFASMMGMITDVRVVSVEEVVASPSSLPVNDASSCCPLSRVYNITQTLPLAKYRSFLSSAQLLRTTSPSTDSLMVARRTRDMLLRCDTVFS